MVVGHSLAWWLIWLTFQHLLSVLPPTKEESMNKIVIILLAFLLVGCASYQPIADLKASKNANDYQEDRQHCRLLIKEEFNAFYAAWYDRELLSRCLNGRGHNVLNTYTIGN